MTKYTKRVAHQTVAIINPQGNFFCPRRAPEGRLVITRQFCRYEVRGGKVKGIFSMTW